MPGLTTWSAFRGPVRASSISIAAGAMASGSSRKGLPPDLATRLAALAVPWRAGALDGAAFAARYFLAWQIAIHGREFASRRDRGDARPDAAEWLADVDGGADPADSAAAAAMRDNLASRMERHHFRGIPGSVPLALAHWLRDAWPLVAREDIPAAVEVLRMQARGRRPVTIITDWPRAREPVMTRPDAFAFFLHDLEHGWKFCHSPELHAGQRDFFARLAAALDRGVFAPYLEDPAFVTRFHYLAGDMNTHPEHSRQYLRAILIEFFGRREGCGPMARLSGTAEQAIEAVIAAVDGA